MKKLQVLASIVAIAVIYSCSTQVKTVNPESTNLENYQTYAYLPNSSIEGNKSNSGGVSKMVIKTVKMNLQNAGYQLETKNPDLLVLISSKKNAEISKDSDPVYAAYPYATNGTAINPYYANYYYTGYQTFGNILGYNTDTYSYQEGTVVIDLVDRKTRKTVWKGMTSQSLVNETDLEAQKEMVNQIFSKFPLFQKDKE